MKAVSSRTAGRVMAGLVPLLLVAAALPLLGPTCGGFTPGVKSFSRGSLIIPMDVCYQCSTDADGNTSPSACGQASYVTPAGPGLAGGFACPQATDAGDVIKAYGLVYQLIRNGVAVYWSINPSKTHLDDTDLTISYSGGPPVQRYDWNTGGSGTAPTNGTAINYRGGPFIVDGSDYAKASAILQANNATFSTVKLHVSNVAFQAPVARTMAGGWTAGLTIPPKLALLDIGSAYADGTNAKNSEGVIRGYLTKAGLDFTGAGGTSAAGQHGQIYDRLVMADFLPSTPGDWKTTKLYQNGYQILWVPHWAAPGSCSDVTSCSTTQYSDTDVSTVITTVGSFVTDATLVGGKAAGLKDVFAECAGLGSFEGVPGNATYSPSWILPAQNSTHFETEITPGFGITLPTPGAPFYWGSFPNPLMQIGDFTFHPVTGAIATFKATDYQAGVVRLISDTTDTTKDVFTLMPSTGAHGTIVYMGGHTYSGNEGSFQTAGSRLVLNSLFNLGASCIASGVSCSTGLLGICATGTMTCDVNGSPVCTPNVLPNTRPEICNGLDDNCNGLVDEGLTTGCYDGPGATRNVGLCRDGIQSCEKQADGTYAMGTCVGEQLPSAEVCNGLDDNCNGSVDEGLTQACYDGPANTISPTSGLPMGICQPGVRTCTNGAYGSCAGEVLPLAAEYCGGDGTGNGADDNCNGLVDEGCGCTGQPPRGCYAGPAGTAGVGACKAGTQTCVSNAWSACVGQVLPVPEICGNGIDDDCNNIVDDPLICNLCPVTPPSCYDGAAATLTPPLPVADNATCKAGIRACSAGVLGACEQQILPSQELCDGKDNNCNGTIDEGASCGTGFQCVNGVCVFGTCAPEFPCPEGYACTGVNPTTGLGNCTIFGCGGGAACTAGFRCLNGACVDPCLNINCGAGSICAGGLCTGGSCYSSGCGTGLICQNGGCVADPCAGVACPNGTFCRSGDCVQECTFVTCAAGQRCGIDGFCVADPCSGASCPANELCNVSTGACEPDLCASLSCGAGQRCEAGLCIDDPCATIQCPVGTCYRGQCFPSSNLGGIGAAAPPPPPGKSSGCGCATDAPSPAMVLLALLALPLGRRRRGRGAGGLSGLTALALAAGLTGLLSGCPAKKDQTADLLSCAETCGEQRCVDVGSDAAHCGKCSTPCVSGEICVDGSCGPGSAIAPFIQAVTPASAGKGSTTVPIQIVGERFQNGATLRVIPPPPALPTSNIPTDFTDSQHLQASVNVSTYPVETIYVRVVNPDKVISPVYPIQIVPVTPSVTAWTPNPLVVKVGPTPATLHAVGTGLTTGSLCHIKSSATLIDQALPTLNQTGTALDCTLDTTGLVLGTYDLWVVNDGLLASSKSTLTLTSDALSISSLSPSSGAQGSAQPVSVTVYGSGFNNTSPSIVSLSSTVAPGTTYVVQVTSYLDPTRLLAQLDLNTYPAGVKTPLPAGTYNLKVSNGAIDSPPTIFTIISNPPTASTVSFAPQPIYQNATETVTVTGANLPSNTVVQVLKPGATIPVSLPTTWNSATQVTGTLALTPTSSWPAGAYQILLSFPTFPSAPGTSSASFPFSVLSNVALLSSVTPAGDPQGTSGITLAVTGANFFSGMHVVALGLGAAGADVDLVATVSTTSSASAGPLTLVGRDTGLYRIVARNTGAADSNSLAFNVTPGVPTIVSRAPTSATQSGTPVTVTITGTNFAKPDANGNGGSQVVAWNTGFLADGVTQIIPAASPINVATLSGSSVAVTDSQTIVVTLDTRSVLATASPYTIQVWNPGGPTPPQKSNTTTFTVQ